MSSIKAKNTKPELIIRRLLYANGLAGYRLHWKIEGKPDIAYVSKKLAIFIHGCFWHKCPTCQLPLPRSNSSFWEKKLINNVERDAKKKQILEGNDWKVLTFWECEVKAHPMTLIRQIQEMLTDVEN
jgi:DNA mismatch endonuclease (patch repair protein)